MGFGDTGLSNDVQIYPIRYPQMPQSDAKIRTVQPREKQYKVADFDGLSITVKPNGSRL